MNTLIINSTMEELYIALNTGGKMFSKSICSSVKHNEMLLTKIDEILKEVKIKIQDLSALGVVVGPGSFTGIRVGISTIKAFRDVLNIEARGINNLTLLFRLAERQNPECEVVAIAGSSDTFFVARKLFDAVYIYERNLSLNELKKIAGNLPVGMYKEDERIKSFEVKIDPEILFLCFKESKDFKLVPVYYQLSQAEREKLKCASVEICEAELEDIPIIASIEKESFSSNVIKKSEFARLFENENYRMFLIKLDGAVAGFIVLEITDEINIITVAIKREFRNLGLASRLIEHAKLLAAHLDIKTISIEVSVKNPTAYLLYEKNGFVLRRTRKNYYADGADCLEMMLRI